MNKFSKNAVHLTILAAALTASLAVAANAQKRIDWSTQPNQLGLAAGGRATVLCPGNGTFSSRLWGTDLYTDDSSICTAAVHAGLITREDGGAVTIELRSGAQSYSGSSRHSVTSKDYGAWGGSFVFVKGAQNQPSEETVTATWSTQVNQLKIPESNRQKISCPPGTLSSRLWGTDIYTDDSSICTAAVHAGLISTRDGGTFIIERRPGLNAYQGSSRNGVTSDDYGAWTGSFAFVGGAPSGPISIDGSWNNGMLHIWQNGEALVVTAYWLNSEGRNLFKATGWIRGRDVYFGDVVMSPMMHGPTKAKYEYFLKVSDDGRTLEGHWTGNGQHGSELRYVKDR